MAQHVVDPAPVAHLAAAGCHAIFSGVRAVRVVRTFEAHSGVMNLENVTNGTIKVF